MPWEEPASKEEAVIINHLIDSKYTCYVRHKFKNAGLPLAISIIEEIQDDLTPIHDFKTRLDYNLLFFNFL